MPIEYLTVADFGAIGHLLAYQLDRLAVRISPGSDWRVLLDDLEWLGSGDPTAKQPDVAFAVDRKRAARAFLKYEQAWRMARALTFAGDLPGARSKAALIAGRFDRLLSLQEKAQDVLFEFEVAGRLSSRGVDVVFEEPDIVIRTPKQDIGLACKRPRSIDGVANSIRRATKQIRQTLPGVIVIGIEAIVQHEAPSSRPVVWAVSDPEHLHQGINEHLDELLSQSEAACAHAFEEQSVLGVLFCGVVTAWSSAPNGFIWEWAHRTVPNPNVPGAKELLDALEETMFTPPEPEATTGSPGK